MAIDYRSILGEGIDKAVKLERSPLAEGFIAGFKAALLGAPLGAGIQAVRGKNPLVGALAGAILPGIVAGVSRAAAQKVENLNTEAAIRYHASNIKAREPLFFMPPQQYMGKYFSDRYR